MNLSEITPVVLTYNEAHNIERTLTALSWASDIVVVDSDSDDGTPEIVKAHPKARLFTRAFDQHARQWNFAVGDTSVATEWILALDADYVLTESFVEELRALQPPEGVAAYANEFEYCIFGQPLRGSVYPRVTTLFRRGLGEYVQDGHTQRLRVRGAVGKLASRMRHDDRKPIGRWLAAQDRYMRLEAEKLLSTPGSQLTLPDRIRKAVVIAPALVLIFTLFFRGAILDGRAGLFYAMQRTLAEMILSLHLLLHWFRRGRS